jgi:hypothetical protein
LSVLFPTLSGSTAMPGIELPVHVPDMVARKARCAQAELKSNHGNQIQKLQKWQGWRCHAEQARAAVSAWNKEAFFGVTRQPIGTPG